MTPSEKKPDDQVSPDTTVLLVDDDALIAESLGFMLQRKFNVLLAETRPEAKELLSQAASIPSVAIVDLGLPPFPHRPDEGFHLIRDLIAYDRHMKILVLSGQDEDENIQHALTLGAVDFISKPVEPDLLLNRLEHHLRLHDIELKSDERADDEFIGACESMGAVRHQIEQFSDSPFPVLIMGESGTGKEIVARALHDRSRKRAEPYLVINCAAIAPDLLEAQLFGHRKGAFTGADKDHEGFFAEVGDGTLFLDEIGELPLQLQSKLLRVLENGEYYRLGETMQRTTNARVVAATNKNLVDEVAAGRFRGDLYHRLSILNITMPRLHDREDDRFLLLDHFQEIYKESVPPFSLDESATELWRNYTFPGNVRELRNLVIRLGTKYPGQVVDREKLDAELETRLLADGLSERTEYLSDEYIRDKIISGEFALDDVVSEIESRCIRIALELNDNSISKAANALNINRTTLYSRVNKLGNL